MKCKPWCAPLLGALVAIVMAGQAAAQFTPGNLVVERLGDGGAPITSAATPGFLDQYSALLSGQTAPSFTVVLPTTVGTAGNPLASTDSGTATSNGYFTLAANGTMLVTTGYNSAPGTAGVAGSDPATTFRTIGMIGPSGSVNTNNGFNNGPVNNYRGVATVDGSTFYATTAAGTFVKSNTGTVENATQLVTNNSRNVRIVNNSLFISTSSGTAANNGIFLVGSAGALPTAATTTTQLPGLGSSGTGTPSAYGFALVNNPLNTNNWNGTGLNTLYTADDRTSTAGGGIQRWVFDGTTWTLTATVAPGAAGLRGLTAGIAGNSVTLYGTTAETTGNNLVALTDALTASGGTFGAFTTLATAPTNTIFRGVSFAPVPEPTSILAVCGAGFGAVTWLRRRYRKSATLA